MPKRIPSQKKSTQDRKTITIIDQAEHVRGDVLVLLSNERYSHVLFTVEGKKDDPKTTLRGRKDLASSSPVSSAVLETITGEKGIKSQLSMRRLHCTKLVDLILFPRGRNLGGFVSVLGGGLRMIKQRWEWLQER